MHNRGLKLGIYGDMGKLTCMAYPGTPLDKIELDAQTFADWEVDMLKYDGCYSNATEQELGKNTRLNLFCVDNKILLIGPHLRSPVHCFEQVTLSCQRL